MGCGGAYECLIPARGEQYKPLNAKAIGHSDDKEDEKLDPAPRHPASASTRISEIRMDDEQPLHAPTSPRKSLSRSKYDADEKGQAAPPAIEEGPARPW